jgi:3-methyladenine DNA glycosylase AlkD
MSIPSCMKLYLPPDVEQKLREAISQDDLDLFSEFASPLKWGKPSWSASQLLLHMLADNEKRMWHWAVNLTSQENPHIRRYASRLLLNLWEKDRPRAEKWLKKLADDEHWVVREDAHNVWGRLLGKHFKEIKPVLRSWTRSSSANLRRCVVIAVRKTGNLRKEDLAEPLISLLELLLSDKTPYVRKNLGPFAIGDGLLRCYPSITMKYLHKWAGGKDEGTLWNVAMAFASYGGNKNWKEGTRILSALATDERRYVWRAVASAMLYLARRRPEVHDMLRNWLKDSERVKVAETALKHLTKKS